MLHLVSSRQAPSSQTLSGHIAEYAPALALCALGLINNSVSYASMKKICTEHLYDWWQFSVPSGTPESRFESVYWHLLHLLESQEEYQLLGNSFNHHKIKSCALYLLGLGPEPEKLSGIRP